jgi:2-succinyl-6-hydroxy-2,4-cyclohexadiene-1-carboxylate synthase
VVSEGAGPPAIVLHGFTGSSESMQVVSDALRDTHRVHRVDLLGFGQSDAPRDPAAYTMDRCVAQLTSMLDALALGRVHCVGYSMGGRVALSLAIAHADRVASLALVGATPGIADAASRAARVAADEALAERIFEHGLETFVDEWMALPLFASQRRLGQAPLARARAERMRNRPEVLAASLRGMGTGRMPPLQQALARLCVPVLLAVGGEDAKFCAIARDMAALLPDARVGVIDTAGHAAHLEQPEAFTRLLISFLTAVEDRSAA